MSKDELEFTVTVSLKPDGMYHKYTITHKSDKMSDKFKEEIWDTWGLDVDTE